MIVTPEYNVGYCMDVELAESLGLIRTRNAEGRNVAVMAANRVLAEWKTVENLSRRHYALCVDNRGQVVTVLYHKGTTFSAVQSFNYASCTVDADLNAMRAASEWLTATLTQKVMRAMPRLIGRTYRVGGIVRILAGCPLLTEGVYVTVKNIYKGIETPMLEVLPLGKTVSVMIAAKYAETVYPMPDSGNIYVMAALYAANVNWQDFARGSVPLIDLWARDLLYPKRRIQINVNGKEFILSERRGGLPREQRKPLLLENAEAVDG